METGKKKILVVDDDETVRMVSIGMINHFGYATLEAVDGTDALRVLAESNGNLPDLVFSDIDMPEINGIGLYDQSRELYHGLPFLMTSGNINRHKVELDARNLSYLEKPILDFNVARSKFEEILTS